MFADAIAATSDECNLLVPIVLGARPVVLHAAAQKIVEESRYTDIQEQFQTPNSSLMVGGDLLTSVRIVGEQE